MSPKFSDQIRIDLKIYRQFAVWPCKNGVPKWKCVEIIWQIVVHDVISSSYIDFRQMVIRTNENSWHANPWSWIKKP